uniref:Uncharacterized protein n=1 Tax=Romanomermis culicivorax TaxID=13658 RepID=A0A915J6D8_ROMCU
DITSDEDDETIVDGGSENIISEEEDNILEEEGEGTILDYDDEDAQYKSIHNAHQYLKRHLCFMQPVGSEQIEGEEDVFETNDDDDNDEC